jgi:hypothetical protein
MKENLCKWIYAFAKPQGLESHYVFFLVKIYWELCCSITEPVNVSIGR